MRPGYLHKAETPPGLGLLRSRAVQGIPDPPGSPGILPFMVFPTVLMAPVRKPIGGRYQAYPIVQAKPPGRIVQRRRIRLIRYMGPVHPAHRRRSHGGAGSAGTGGVTSSYQ